MSIHQTEEDWWTARGKSTTGRKALDVIVVLIIIWGTLYYLR